MNENTNASITLYTIQECTNCGWIGFHKDKSFKTPGLLRHYFCPDCKGDSFQIPDELDADAEIENDFIRCKDCDGHDACEDFGCAIKQGIISPSSW